MDNTKLTNEELTTEKIKEIIESLHNGAILRCHKFITKVNRIKVYSFLRNDKDQILCTIFLCSSNLKKRQQIDAFVFDDDEQIRLKMMKLDNDNYDFFVA